ncbi:MAG: DDE-type integrase/transposase/recombinase [Proteobacteria bacterium]|nr:DDE-type integrase/transposase/recombinase [Pseudomonadota bacterium]
MDGTFGRVSGAQHLLWRAIDKEGAVVDVFRQKRRNAKVAKSFFNSVSGSNGKMPTKIVTDKLGSYRVAHRELPPHVIHNTTQ